MGLLSNLFDPKAPHSTTKAHHAFGDLIRVLEAPASPGWVHSELHSEEDEFSAMVLKYVLPMSPLPLGLLAKIYTVEPAPEDPRQRDWRAKFEPLFSQLSTIEVSAATQRTMRDSIAAYEAVAEGLGVDPVTPLRIRERRAVVDKELFVVAAIGTPAAFEKHASEIAKWFSTCVFVPVGDTEATF